jgi:hypothetical protein
MYSLAAFAAFAFQGGVITQIGVHSRYLYISKDYQFDFYHRLPVKSLEMRFAPRIPRVLVATAGPASVAGRVRFIGPEPEQRMM